LTAVLLLGAGLVFLSSEGRSADKKAPPQEGDLPITGKAEPGLEPFDQAMQQFMKARHIPGGVLAVLKDGELVLERGYGHADHAGKQLLGPDRPFRIASLTKPITAAAIWRLIRLGKLGLNTRVVDVLKVNPPADKERDPRWNKITIRHLLEHRGGWDRDKIFDPMFCPLEIASALGKKGPATQQDIITYMAGQPLQFEPGSKSVYSNFGYCLLGRVIEKVSGQTYVEYIQQKLLAPLGIRSVALARTLPRDRNPREPFYADPESGRNVVEPNRRDPVPAPDGTFCIEALDSHGGLIATARDLARFFRVYSIDGQPVAGRVAGYFFGSLPGSFTVVVQREGVVMVALFNQRRDPSGRDYFQIREVLERAADRAHWPER
jgi:N-acyl-D-amino-acid deacylase